MMRAFQGVSAIRAMELWSELSPVVRDAILAAQDGALGAVAGYLGGLVGESVAVDPAPWVGRVGRVSLADWLAVTPRAHAARMARGMTPTEAAVATADYVARAAGAEPFRITREAVAVTASRDYRFTGWARVAEPGACAFCRMLATRGAVYTEQAVTRTFAGLKYHTRRPNGSGGDCKCIAKAVPMTVEGRGRRAIRRAVAPAAAA